MFFKPKEKKLYADLPTSVRNSNAKKFYKQFGSDEIVRNLPKNKRAKMRRYNMEVARAYDRDTYEGNDVNRGLQDINKKYGFQTFSESCYFLNDIAEFETAYARYLKNKANQNRINNSSAYSPGFDPNVWQRRSNLERKGIPVDNRGNIIQNSDATVMTEKQLRRNVDTGTRELYGRDDTFVRPDASLSKKTKTGYTKRQYDGDAFNQRLSKEQRISRLSVKNRKKIMQNRYSKIENPWEKPTTPPTSSAIKPTTVNTPKPQLLLAPAKTPPTIPVQNLGTKTTTTAVKPVRKLVNKYTLGVAGVLGAGAVGYGGYKLLSGNKNKEKRGMR